MAQREGTIYLTLFIIMFVLFAVMTTLFIQTNTEVSKLQGQLKGRDREIADQVDRNRRLVKNVTGLQRLIGGEEYAGADKWPGNEFFLTQLKDKAEDPMGAVRTAVGQAARPYPYLVAPYDDIPSTLTKLRDDLAKANADRRAALDTQVQDKASADEALATVRAESSKLLSQISDLETAAEDLKSRSEEKEQEYVTQIDELRDTHSDEITLSRRQLMFASNQIKSLQNRLDRLQEEVKKEKSLDDVEPDASVLAVLTESGKAWVDIGRTDHLQKGLIFRVFQYVKGGKRQYKGRIEIRKVEDRKAEARIIEEIDSLNPITPGDFIASPFYDPEANPVFVFAGNRLQSKRVTRDYVESRMKQSGAVIGSKVDLDTDFLIATENYESSPEYRAAKDLGVTVIRERDLLEFIGL